MQSEDNARRSVREAYIPLNSVTQEGKCKAPVVTRN